MGNLVFPTLPGVKIGIKKSPVWSTIVQTAASLRESRIAVATSPVYNFELPLEFLRTPYRYQELQTVLGFINLVQGSFDSFLYDDPTDDFAENVLLGTGDGTTVSYQLKRSYGGYTEIINNPKIGSIYTDPLMWEEDLSTPMWSANLSTLMWDAGSGLGPFTVSATGLLTFTTPPPTGTPVYWSGNFYYRCRFLNDINEFDQEMAYYYSHQGLQFVGSLQLKI